MIQLLEFLPYLSFGLVYFLLDKGLITLSVGVEPIIVATQVLLILLIICNIVLYIKQHRKLTNMQWVMLCVTIVFASLTLLVDREIIKWKVTVINSVFGIILMAGYFVKKYPLEYLLNSQLQLPKAAWKTLTLMWAIFFLGMATVNAYLILYTTEATWVAFKSFWSIPITLVFTIIQVVFLMKHLPKEMVGKGAILKDKTKE